MSSPHSDNRRHLLRLWAPALLLCGVVGALIVAALASGDSARARTTVFAVLLVGLFLFGSRAFQKRRFARALQSPDPTALLRSIAGPVRRVPHGTLLAAANSATILALYGRFDEAQHELEAVSWRDIPPLIRAHHTLASAAIAYSSGRVTEGLAHAVAAVQEATLDSQFPGAGTSALAFRTYRNLGLALSGRATESTAEELNTAFRQLPLLGQITAAWGLAVIARHQHAAPQQQAMRAFIQARAPHFAPVFRSIDTA